MTDLVSSLLLVVCWGRAALNDIRISLPALLPASVNWNSLPSQAQVLCGVCYKAIPHSSQVIKREQVCFAGGQWASWCMRWWQATRPSMMRTVSQCSGTSVKSSTLSPHTSPRSAAILLPASVLLQSHMSRQPAVMNDAQMSHSSALLHKQRQLALHAFCSIEWSADETPSLAMVQFYELIYGRHP